jgi:integrase
MSELRAHRPDDEETTPQQSDAGSFRCDQATIAQVLDWWEHNPKRKHESPTAEKERRRLYGLMRAEMGAVLVLSCQPFVLDNFIRADRRPKEDRIGPDIKSNWTLRRWNSTLQQPFNNAELQGLIIKNPFRGNSYPEGDDGRDWTDDELREVLENASDAFAELVIGMRLSSLRPLEACELDKRQIERDARRIKLTDTKGCKLKKKKKHKAEYVPISDPLLQLFDDILARNRPGPRLFLTPKGRPWTRPHADSTFLRLRDKIGLPDDLKLHGCRHTFATHAIMNDVSLPYLQQILRHSSSRTTERYVHLVDKTDLLVPAANRAVQGMEKIIRATEYTPLFDVLE